MAGRSPNKRRGRGRKQPLTVSGVDKAITVVIMMGFSIFPHIWLQEFLPNRKSACEARSAGEATSTSLRRLERFVHATLERQRWTRPNQERDDSKPLPLNPSLTGRNVARKGKIGFDHSQSSKVEIYINSTCSNNHSSIQIKTRL